MLLSPALLGLLPFFADLPTIPRNFQVSKRGNPLRAQARAEARDVMLVICKHQRAEEQRWREGGPKPKWLKPHASARNWSGQRWSTAANGWVPV